MGLCGSVCSQVLVGLTLITQDGIGMITLTSSICQHKKTEKRMDNKRGRGKSMSASEKG